MEPLFSTNHQSRRTAIIDRAGEALWLYLTGPGDMSPVSDCWLANLASNGPALSIDELRASGSPPPAPDNALIESLAELPQDPAHYRVQWSRDGESVQALAGDRPIAFVTASEKAGYHLAIRVESPWGRPFDDSLHASLFT